MRAHAGEDTQRHAHADAHLYVRTHQCSEEIVRIIFSLRYPGNHQLLVFGLRNYLNEMRNFIRGYLKEDRNLFG